RSAECVASREELIGQCPAENDNWRDCGTANAMMQNLVVPEIPAGYQAQPEGGAQIFIAIVVSGMCRDALLLRRQRQVTAPGLSLQRHALRCRDFLYIRQIP